MSSIVSGTHAWTGNELGGFETVGQTAGGTANVMPFTLINGSNVASGDAAYARAPFGGYFQGVILYIGENNHDGVHNLTLNKVTAADNYVTKTPITSLQITIEAFQRGYFWSNPNTSRGTRFWRLNDALGIDLTKDTGINATGISDVSVTVVYDFVKGI